MFSYSRISLLFVLLPLLNNFISFPPAQSSLMTSIIPANTLPTMDNEPGMDAIMPGMGVATTTLTNTAMAGSTMAGMSSNMATGQMPADFPAMMSNMNEMMMMCMADMMNSNKKWYWIGGSILALILLGLLGWWLWRNRARFTSGDAPLLILQRRLAQGEITLEQYEAVKVQLGTVAAGAREL